jgi:putative tricarboxylic transport membrane protein
MGAPTSAAEAATVMDGHALARQGQGGRAIGASLAASLVGGAAGAILLLALAPMALGAARHLGSPEIAAISIAGLLSISALSGGSMAGGLVSAALGVAIATIGIDPITGISRFTGGAAALGDGINPAALVTGLFVIPELVARAGGLPPPTRLAAGREQFASVWAGFCEALTFRWLLLRVSVLSALVGMAPGLGASVAVWIAYGHARQTQPSVVPYGEGALAGVIAPEAANNAKEGGALAPTLFFGVPGSSGMGILLTAFMIMGVEVGPRMLTQTPHFVTLLGLTIMVANFLAAPLCFLLLPSMTRVAAIQPQVIAPIAITAGVAATLMTEPGLPVLLMIAGASAIGLALKAIHLPRAPLLLGFVLAPGMEAGVIRSAMIQGWDALTRPGVLIIASLAAGVAVWALISSRRRPAPPVPPAQGMAVVLPVLAMPLTIAVFGLSGAPISARVLPAAAGIVGLLATGLLLLRRAGIPVAEHKAAALPDGLLVLLSGLLLAVAAVANLPVAAAIFVTAALKWPGKVPLPNAALTGLVIGVLVFGLQRLTA